MIAVGDRPCLKSGGGRPAAARALASSAKLPALRPSPSTASQARSMVE